MMQFKGTPLFGQDSSPQYTSKVLGYIGTGIFWIILTICMIVIKPSAKKPEYKEIQIVLSSEPVKAEDKNIQMKNEVPAPINEVSKLPEPSVQPSIQKTETVKKDTPSKTVNKTESVKKTSSSSSVKQEQKIELAEDPMEAFARQTSKKTQKDFDWSVFDDEPAVETSKSEQTVDEPFQAFSGNAGKAASESTKTIKSQANEKESSFDNSSADSDTIGALKSITNTKSFSGAISSENGVSSKSEVRAGNNINGKVMLEMSNGKTRALLNPKEPVINLSKEAAATIDANKEVIISFTVLKDGNVIKIEISPSNILKEIVQNEIKSQVEKWIFEPADYIAQAKFNYKIIKQ